MNFIKVFRVVAAVNAFSLVIFNSVQKDDVMDNYFSFHPPHLLFLTDQVNVMLLFFFATKLIAELTNNNDLKQKANQFTGAMHAFGTFIGLMYYALVYNDPSVRELMPKRPLVVQWGVHWNHLISLIMVQIELVVASIEGVKLDWKREFRWNAGYALCYQLWSWICAAINQKWPYPFQDGMDMWQHIILFCICVVIVSVLNLVGNGINYWIRTSRFATTKESKVK